VVPQHGLTALKAARATALGLAATVLALAAPAAHAAYTGTVDPSAQTATLTGSQSIGLVTRDGLVQHGDIGPGFASEADFDSTQPGDQTVPDTGGWSITATGGGGDTLDVQEGEPVDPVSFAFGHTFFPGGVPCVVRDPNDRQGAIAFSQHPSAETRFCYEAGFKEVDVRAGSQPTDFSVLDTEAGVTLKLFGGPADDTMTEAANVQSSADMAHNPASPVYFSGGAGQDQQSFDDGPATDPATYTVKDGTIKRTGLPALHFDSTVEQLVLYPQQGPSKIVQGRTGGTSLEIFGGFFGQSGPDNIDARGADAPLFATGSSGDDTIIGGVFPDVIDGGGGNDTIDSRDASFDQVMCRGGTGAVRVDTLDQVTGCPTARSSAPRIALTSATLKPGKVKRGKPVTLDVATTAPGTVTLTFKRGRFKTVPVVLGPNSVKLKPPSKLGKGRYSVTVRLRTSDGKQSNAIKLSLTIR
jgi:hypothetical protein